MGSFTSSSWVTSLCGSPICSGQDATSCVLKQILDSSTCTNHLAVTGAAALLGFVLALQLLVKIPQSRASARQLVTLGSPLHLSAVVFTGCLGLIYLGLGLWMLGSSFGQEDASIVYLPHWWLVTLSQGLNLILTSLTFSIRPRFLGAAFVRSWPVLLTIYTSFVCYSSVVDIVAEKTITMKSCLDVLSLPGAVLLLLYGIRHGHDEECYGENGNGLYNPLNTETDSEVAHFDSQVTPFAPTSSTGPPYFFNGTSPLPLPSPRRSRGRPREETLAPPSLSPSPQPPPSPPPGASPAKGRVALAAAGRLSPARSWGLRGAFPICLMVPGVGPALPRLLLPLPVSLAGAASSPPWW